MNIDELEAGPELDALIAEKAMGWRSSSLPGVFIDEGECFWGITEEIPTSRQFNPSTDIAAAWRVVEKVNLLNFDDDDGNYVLHFDKDLWNISVVGFDWDLIASGNTVPLAICRAALKAVIEQ